MREGIHTWGQTISLNRDTHGFFRPSGDQMLSHPPQFLTLTPSFSFLLLHFSLQVQCSGGEACLGNREGSQSCKIWARLSMILRHHYIIKSNRLYSCQFVSQHLHTWCHTLKKKLLTFCERMDKDSWMTAPFALTFKFQPLLNEAINTTETCFLLTRGV